MSKTQKTKMTAFMWICKFRSPTQAEVQSLFRDLFDEIEKEKRPKWNMRGPMDDDNSFDDMVQLSDIRTVFERFTGSDMKP